MYPPLKRNSELMTREEELFRRRLLDLADTAWKRNIVTFTDFLNLNEQNIYHDTQPELSFLESRMSGGYECAERQMVAFIPDALSYEENFSPEATDRLFPIRCLVIRPQNPRFAETLSHRDYLGSLMNLGIDRGKLGDIVIQDQEAFLFCEEKMAEYLTGKLTRVRHTAVVCEESEQGIRNWKPKLEEISGTVASVRLDALLSLAFRASRSSLSGLIEGGKVFVNGRLVTGNGFHPREGDIVSVRGYGRFRYCGVSANTTKKGRYYVKLEKYV